MRKLRESEKYLQDRKKMESELSKICKIKKKKASLRGNVIVLQGFLKKQDKSQINNLKYHPKQSEKKKESE